MSLLKDIFGKGLEQKQDEVIAGKLFIKIERLIMNTSIDEYPKLVSKINRLLLQWYQDPNKRHMVQLLLQKLCLRFSANEYRQHPFIMLDEEKPVEQY